MFDDKAELLDAALDAALDPAPLDKLLREIDPTLPFEQRLIEATELTQERIVEVWRLISSLGRKHKPNASRSMTDSVGLVEIFASEPERCRLKPADAARRLRALTMALTHPMLSNEQVSADEIVATILHGIAVDDLPGSKR